MESTEPMKTDTKWLRLTKDQLKTFDIPSYEWEVVLIKDGTTTSPTDKDLHFNAQEYFSEEELSAMPIFQPMKTDTPPQPAHGEPIETRPCDYASGFEDGQSETQLAAELALSGFEVHSKETMDEVRALLKVFHESCEACDVDFGYGDNALSALAKLNPPQG